MDKSRFFKSNEINRDAMKIININKSNEIEICLFGFTHYEKTLWKLIIYLSPEKPFIYFRGEWA